MDNGKNITISIVCLFEKISQYSMQTYFMKFGEIEETLKELENNFKTMSLNEQNIVLIEMMNQIKNAAPWIKVHMLSFCMWVSHHEKYVLKLLDYILNASYDEIGEYNKLSHFWQISAAQFLNQNLQTIDINKKLDLLYVELFQEFRNAFGLEKSVYIPWEERNHDLVIVFSPQVLGMEHAPTKTLLDRCYVLKKQLKKEVIIINTAMQMPAKGQAPFYRLSNATYADELSQIDHLEFKGETFEFYQCENKMPDLDIIASVIRRIKSMKPELIISIGGCDICADLCGLFIPQVTISTVFSKIAISCGKYQMVDKKLSIEDKEELAILGVDPQNVKRTTFTFSFKEQTHNYTKEQLGIDSSKFVILIVGWRLDQEIDDQFLDMIDQILQEKKNIQIVFMGKFDTYKEKIQKYEEIEKNSINLGKQEDALAVVECCNLYVNPQRRGGGSSAAEALYKGLPVVTLPIGDVAVVAGRTFWVKNYADMKTQIIKYDIDKEYYRNNSQKAKRKAKKLLDSNEFVKGIEDIVTKKD